jgi:hypothetical protein
MKPYKGYHIDESTFQIYRNNKEVFTAWHQRNYNYAQALAMIDQSINETQRIDSLPVEKTKLLTCEMDGDEINDNIRSFQ